MAKSTMAHVRRGLDSTTVAAALWSLAWACACSSPTTSYPQLDAQVMRTLEQLVSDYEGGAITRDEFRAAVANMDDPGMPTELSRDIDTTTLLAARDTPYRVTADITVAADAILVIEEGAQLVLGSEVSVVADGRVYAIGSQERPIGVRAPDGQHYGAFRLNSGPNQLVWMEFDRGTHNVWIAHPVDTTTLIDSARFDSWVSLAVVYIESSGLRIVNSRFGYETSESEVSGETIGTLDAGAIVVEHSQFNYRRGYRDVMDIHRCLPGYWSVIAHNVFDGGEDDAIDLDGCDALVIGNHIRNFRPQDLQAMVGGVNGGGITGDAGSRPVIINNVIDGCYHGIGFKNGSRPMIINNTIVNSNIGITLYTSELGRQQPHGVIINNILANNVGWIDGGQANDIVLHGKWWPSYNQVDDVQATAEVRYNVLASADAGFPDDGNTSADPLLDSIDGIPVPGAGSPALDSGLAALSLTDVPVADVLDHLARDFRDTPRQRIGDEFPGIDRGAIEASP